MLFQNFFSSSRSSQGSPDWTCVFAGFSTGFIRIYTNVSHYYLLFLKELAKTLQYTTLLFSQLSAKHNKNNLNLFLSVLVNILMALY